MAAKVRLPGNKLYENVLKVCSETEAVPNNVISNGCCDFCKVSHTEKRFSTKCNK